jgi:CBS domain-containing protein
MKCPDCGFENVSGNDDCQGCGVALSSFDPQGNDFEQSIETHPINVLCPREPICVPPETPVREVIDQMAEANVGCVLVECEGAIRGVFSERDLLNKVVGDDARLTRPVSEFMTPSPTTVTKRDSIGYALQTMDLGGYRHLPIVNASQIAVGLLSTRDILRFLCVKYAQSRDAIQVSDG